MVKQLRAYCGGLLLGLAGLGWAPAVQAQLTVTGIVPAVNAPSVPRSSSLTLTLDQPLSAGSQAALHVFSSQRGGQRAGTSGSTAVLGSSITFTPSAYEWRPGETVQATLSTAAQSTSGQALAASRVFQFTAATGGTGQGRLITPLASPEVPTGTAPNGVALGDIDGDGDLDMVTANLSANTVSVRLNTGLSSGTFEVPAVNPEPAVGTNPRYVRLADVDGDGDLDLLTINLKFGFSGSLSVRLNKDFNTGNFVAPASGAEVPLGRTPGNPALGDVDGDGDLDLLAANEGGSISVRLNAGLNSGTFIVPAANAEITSVADPGYVALGDLDNDGDLDLVSTSSSPTALSIRLNTGTGAFVVPAANASPTTEAGVRSVALGDIDGDGDLDLVAGGDIVTVRLNNGLHSASFIPGAGFVYAIHGLAQLALGDVDADGDLDLIIVSANQYEAGVRYNKGLNSGLFTEHDEKLEVSLPGRTTDIALGDLDGDGDLDLTAAGGFDNNAVSVRLNQLGAAPVPAPVITAFSPGSGPVGTVVTLTGAAFKNVSAVTINGLSVPNYTVVSATTITLTVPPGASTGLIAVTTPGGTATTRTNFTVLISAFRITGLAPGGNQASAPAGGGVAVTFSQPVSGSAGSRGALRVFGSQHGQLAGTVSPSGNTLSFAPAGAFKPGETIQTTVTQAVRSTTNEQLRTPHVQQFTAAVGGAGRGYYRPGTEVATGAYPGSVAVGDVDGDGDLDLAVANNTNTVISGNGYATVSVRLNGGNNSGSNTGTFGGTQEVLVSQQPGVVVLADVDNDGDLDMLTACEGNSDGMFNVRLNGGDASGSNTGVFSGGSNLVINSGPVHLATGDIDGDGDLDVVLVAQYTAYVSVLVNDGSGVFGQGIRVPGGRRPTNVALGDVDNDGDLDLLIANTYDGSVYVELNGGDATGSNTGVFTLAQNIFLSGGITSLALGDIDGDHDLDLLAGNSSEFGTTVNVQLNGGDATGANPGVFSAGTSVAVGGPVSGITLGDIDADGDLDLLATYPNYYGAAAVFLNGGDGLGTATGIFGGRRLVAVGNTPASLALGDVDGDGDLDLLTANRADASVSVRLNTDGGGILTSSAAAVCAGPNAGTLTLSYAASPILGYQADTGAGYQPLAGTTPTLPFSNLAVTTTFRAVVRNSANQTVYSTPVTVVVNPLPTATLVASGPTTFCAGGSVLLRAAGGSRYQFLLNGQVLAGATAADYPAAAAGTYTVAVTNSLGCTSTSAGVVVVVNPPPATPTITVARAGAATVLSSSAPAGNQWYLNGTAIVGATSQTYSVSTAAQLGSYSVVVTNSQGCASGAASPFVVLTALQPLAGASLALYPNPTTTGHLLLRLAGYHQAVELTVFNALGQAVYQHTLPAGQTQQALDLSGQPPGLYVLRATTPGSLDTRVIVRQ
jgi:hypothetical protein